MCRQGGHWHEPVAGGAHGARQPPDHGAAATALGQAGWIVRKLITFIMLNINFLKSYYMSVEQYILLIVQKYIHLRLSTFINSS